MTTTAGRRGGFTLLEVLLAAVIAIMLMAALYSALEVTLTRTQLNRERIDASALSRAVVNRMTADLTGVLGPLPPKAGGTPADSSDTASTLVSSSSSSSSSGGGSGSGTGTTTTTTTDTNSTTTAGGSGGSGAAAADTGAAADIPFGAGLIGTSTQVTVFTVRVPVGLTDPDAIATPDVQRPGDARRVSYYLGSMGGLCRQDRPWATADGVRNSAYPDYTLEESDLIAPEVVDVLFEYFDPATGSWLTEWDGSELDEDGVTIYGPPRAIRVTLTLTVPANNGGTTQRQVQHVIPVRTGVGSYTPPADDGTGTTAGGN
jgi:type II secretory pathway pseudopilin PulG